MIPALIAGGIAAASLASNLYNSSADREARKDALKRLTENQTNSNAKYDEILRGIDQYYADRGSLGKAEDATAYRNAILGYNPKDYVYNPTDFSDEYNKTANDFINPLRDKIVANEVAGIQHSAILFGHKRCSKDLCAFLQRPLDLGLVCCRLGV